MARKKGFSNAGAARRRQRKAQASIETRQKKEFAYRGKSIEELQAMSLDDLLVLLPSKVRRSYSRGVSVGEKKFLTKVEDAAEGEGVRTHYRHLAVLPRFVGKIVNVYDGQNFVPVTIQPEMIGHRLGEFAPSTKYCAHSGVGVGATRGSKHVPLK